MRASLRCMHVNHTRRPTLAVTTTPPAPAVHRPAFRTVRTEVQRSTAGGGWETIAVAENTFWSGAIADALTFLARTPAYEDGEG